MSASDRAAGTTPALLYECKVFEDKDGWWLVSIRYGTKANVWQTVARVFGQKRAEICRDALSQEANERV